MKRLIATTALSFALAAPALSFATTTGPTSSHTFIDSSRLLKADIRTPQGTKVGDVDGVLLDKSGQTEAVIVDVGGFLGMGEHRVAMTWNDLKVSDEGRKVTTAYTKDQLKALPEYKYPDQKARNTAFYDPMWYPVAGVPSVAMNTPPAKPTPPSENWHRVAGEIKASKLMDAKVRSMADEDIGNVKDVLVDADGKVRSVVVDVGGFLGMGSRQVALNFATLQMRHKGDDLRLTTAMTKDQLKNMPAFTDAMMMADAGGSASHASGGGHVTSHKVSATRK